MFGSLETASSGGGNYTPPDLPIADNSITFDESGLHGQTWSVTLSGPKGTQTYSSSSGQISLGNMSQGAYSYSVSGETGYSSSPSSGSFYLGYSNFAQTITYTPSAYYTLTFQESGLPSGTEWGINFQGSSYTTTSTSISFSEPDGDYSFTALDASSGGVVYYPSPSSGTVTVNGTTTQGITYSTSSCVYALTKIMMANGTYEFAENITAGESIMTYNMSTGVLEPEVVVHAYEVNQSGMYTINGNLKIAPDQKVLTERGYVEAQNLTMNDTVYDVYTQNWEPVRSISSAVGTYEMYDFYVGVNHNYVAWVYVLQDKIA